MEIVRNEPKAEVHSLKVVPAGTGETLYHVNSKTLITILSGVARVSLDNGRTYKFYGPSQKSSTFEVKASPYRMTPWGEVKYSECSVPDDPGEVFRNRRLVRTAFGL